MIVSSSPPALSPLSEQQLPMLQMKATAEQFEAVLAGEVAKLMLESIETADDFGGGHGESMFRGVLAEEIGKDLAKRGTLGLASAVLDQMIRMQELGR